MLVERFQAFGWKSSELKEKHELSRFSIEVKTQSYN